MIRLMIQRCCPHSTPVKEGTAESGAYEVQPAAAGPPGTKKLDNMTRPETSPTQKENMLSLGNAMSPAPIMSGIKKLPKPPTMIGMTTKKIMMVACMVKKAL